MDFRAKRESHHALFLVARPITNIAWHLSGLCCRILNSPEYMHAIRAHVNYSISFYDLFRQRKGAFVCVCVCLLVGVSVFPMTGQLKNNVFAQRSGTHPFLSIQPSIETTEVYRVFIYLVFRSVFFFSSSLLLFTSPLIRADVLRWQYGFLDRHGGSSITNDDCQPELKICAR